MRLGLRAPIITPQLFKRFWDLELAPTDLYELLSGMSPFLLIARTAQATQSVTHAICSWDIITSAQVAPDLNVVPMRHSPNTGSIICPPPKNSP